MRYVAMTLFCAVVSGWMLWAFDTITTRREEQIRTQHIEHHHKHCVTDFECCMKYNDCNKE